LPISKIAWLLGYQEAGGFTRSFKRWTGRTPREARASSPPRQRRSANWGDGCVLACIPWFNSKGWVQRGFSIRRVSVVCQTSLTSLLRSDPGATSGTNRLVRLWVDRLCDSFDQPFWGKWLQEKSGTTELHCLSPMQFIPRSGDEYHRQCEALCGKSADQFQPWNIA